MRFCPTVLVGGLVPLGMVIAAALPGVTLTVGRPLAGATALPCALGSGLVTDRTSMRNRTVSVAPTLMSVFPWAPKASFGGTATRTREPTFWLARPFLSPGSRSAVPRLRPRFCLPKLLSRTEASLPLSRTYLTLTISSFWTTGPLPCFRTRVVVSLTLSGLGLTVTVGAVVALPPVTLTSSRTDFLVSEEPPPQADRARTAVSAAAATESGRLGRAWVRSKDTVGTFAGGGGPAATITVDSGNARNVRVRDRARFSRAYPR